MSEHANPSNPRIIHPKEQPAVPMSVAERDMRALCDTLEQERDAARRDLDAAQKEVDATHRESRDLQIENGHLMAIANRDPWFKSDAHPLIKALMDRMVRVMGMEAAGGGCNPHAVVCAALDAAHTFAEEDGTEATERLRDIVRVSVDDVQRLKDREKDATHYQGEWMHARALAEALAAEIGDRAAFKAIKRAKARVARDSGRRVASLLREEYDEEDPATDGERDPNYF